MRVAALSLLAIALPAAAIGQLGKQFDKTYNTGGKAGLQLEADDASIQAQSCGSCREVRIHVDMRDADPSKYELKENQQGSVVHFELKLRHMFSWKMGWSRGPEITVQLPTESDTKLVSGSGSLQLRGVRGNEDVHTGSGGVTAENIGGSLRADTGSGSIRLHGIDAMLSANTGSGSIEGDGKINLRRATTGSGSVHMALADGSTFDGNALIESGSGSVELRMAPSIRAELKLSVGSGSIHSDLPLTVQGKIDEHEQHGTLNGGGPLLRVETGSGSINIRSL